MSKLKKSIIITACSLLCLVTFAIAYFVMPFCVYSKAKPSNLTVYKDENLLVSSSNNIKILQLTDLHINGVMDMPTTYSIMKTLIYTSSPDLIVFTGDIFSNGGEEKHVEQFIKFIEKFQLPWAVALGNHDDETPVSIEELSNRLETAKYSLYKKGDLDTYGNYYYTIKFQDERLFQLIFLDSRRNGFTNETISYYESVVVNSKNLNNGTPINNFVFAHIPLEEVKYAIQEIQTNNIPHSGSIDEEPSTQINRAPFFDKMKELNATKAYICGHDHLNTLRVTYQDIGLYYGIKSSISASNDSTIGGVIYTLKSNGEHEIKDKYISK